MLAPLAPIPHQAEQRLDSASSKAWQPRPPLGPGGPGGPGVWAPALAAACLVKLASATRRRPTVRRLRSPRRITVRDDCYVPIPDGLSNSARRMTDKLYRPETAIASAPPPPPGFHLRDVNVLSGVEELAEHYDGFTLDQYGVLHDGREAFPGVADCLRRLHAKGKPCVILSNYAGRAATQRARLPEIGLDPDHLAGVTTSGELAYRYLSRSGAKHGRRVLWIAWEDRERRGLGDFFNGLEGYTLADQVEEADFILVSGVEVMFAGTSAERKTDFERDGVPIPFLKVFRRAISDNLPMLCANPDLRVVRPGGWQAYLGGSLAKQYEKMGGRVIYFGKPYTSAFEDARQILAKAGAGERVCHVGDSLHHDVAGAAAVGLDAAFVVRTGLHADDLPEELTEEAVWELCEREKVSTPAVAIPRFQW